MLKTLICIENDTLLPKKGHKNDAGYDLFLASRLILEPMEIKPVSTGVSIEIPEGYVGIVTARSSISLQGILIHTGIIDSGYRGEIKIITQNLTSKQKVFRRNDRIAQLLIMPLGDIELYKVDRLSDSDRGTNGFGSTGM